MTTENVGGGEVSGEVSGSTQEVNEASQETVSAEEIPSDVVEGELQGSEGEDSTEEEVSEPELYTITVDGEQIQVTLDELLKNVQTAKASNKRFQEAALTRKQAEEAQQKAQALREELLRNPLQAMLKEGVDEKSIRKHYEDVLYQMYQYDQLSDEEKAARQKEAEQRREFEKMQEQLKELEQLKKEKEEAAFQQQVAAEEERITQEFLAAFEQHNVPNTPEAVQWMANYMAAALEAGEDVDLGTAAALYKQNSSQSLQSFIQSLSEDQLLEYIGEKKLNKLRSNEIQKVKTGKKKAAPSKPLVEQIVQGDGKDVTNMSDFFDSLKRSAYRY